MLKKGDTVMFAIGKTSKVYTVSCDQFVVDGMAFVTIDGYQGFVSTSALVKVQSLFDKIHYEESIEAEFHHDETGEPKEHHILDEEERLILEKTKSHLREGIEELRKRGVRGVNIELELIQHIHKHLRKE